MVHYRIIMLVLLMLAVACNPADEPVAKSAADPANGQALLPAGVVPESVSQGQSTVAVTKSIDVKEWQVPYPASRPRDPFVDANGAVWFCGQAGSYLASLDSRTGEFKKIDMEDGARPHNLIIDDEGFVWFAANTKPYIGRLDPQHGEIKKFAMPDGKASDPHTLVFNRDGDIWFTAQRSNYIGRLNTKSGEVDAIEVPIERARPYGIKMDANDRPWIVLFGTNKIASVDPDTLDLTIFDLPNESTRPRRLEVTSDGIVWYGDYVNGKFGRLDPDTGNVTEWDLPGGEDARPYGSALDDKGVIWIAEDGAPSRIVAFDTMSQQFTSVTDIPNARGAIRHMYFHAPTREIWFGEDTNFIGRLSVP